MCSPYRHCNLALNPPLADQSQEKIDKHYSKQSHSAVGSVKGDGTHPAKGENVNNDGTTGRYSPVSSEGERLDDKQSGYTGPVISMFGHVKGLQNDTNKRESDQVNESEKGESEKDDISYPKMSESSMGMRQILSQETEGMELNLKRGSDKGDRTDPDKGESDKEDKVDSKVPKYKVGTFVIKDVDNISGVLGSYIGVVLTRHHSTILCILLN